MKRLSVHTLLLVCLLGLSAVSAFAKDGADRPRPQQATPLREVHKIYVGDMGKTDEAERFRLLVGDELSKSGFTVVDRAGDADAILSGALSVRVGDNKTEARAFVKLESQTGQRLWARDFGQHFFGNPFDRREPTKRRAHEIAKGLREDWDRAGK
jgi:hypothetical protein